MPDQDKKEEIEGMNTVAAFTDHEIDKYSLLEKVLEHSSFFKVLDQAWEKSTKEKSGFKIAVKPNISMMLRRSDVGTYTDPLLVIHLLRLLLQRGYSSLAVVESRNLYGNWFENRSVAQVAARAGYLDEETINSYQDGKNYFIRVRGSGVDEKVPLIDLTLDATSCDLGEPVGEIKVGMAWVKADFRINFAKMKTHFYSDYTLAIKNIYGCLPEQDKVREYHCMRVVGLWTALLIRAFPVHFSIVDAYSSADGWLGVKMKAICKKPHTIIAGADITAVDHFGAGLMGVKPEKSIMYSALSDLMPLKPYQVKGNASRPNPWRNSPHIFALFSRLIESNANTMDFAGSLATGGYDKCFPHARAARGILKKILYCLTIPVNLLSDIGVLKLRIREKLFMRKLKALKDRIPLISSSKEIISALTFLCPEDMERLAKAIEAGIGEPAFSGHYIFIEGREIPFPARLSTANMAAVEIIKHVKQKDIDPVRFAGELRTLKTLYHENFGRDNKYPYCYN